MTTQTKTRYQVEAFDYSDEAYAACTAIGNAIFPDYPDTPADWKRWDDKRNKAHFFERFVVRDAENDRIVGVGGVGHTSWSYDPHKFFVDPFVHPDFEARGIGSRLYDHLCNRIAPLEPAAIESFTRSDKPRAISFLERRGFELKTREYSSRLQLADFDPQPFRSYSERSEAAGIEFVSLPELRRRFADAWQRKLYDAIIEIDEDIPWHDQLTPDPFEMWIDKFNSNPDRIEEAFLLALDGDEIAGVTMLSRKPASNDTLFTGLTGVRRRWRRKGIAFALKLRALSYAKEQLRTADGGYYSVMTENEENNPMYRINERLGFVRQPDWLNFVKKL